MQWLRSSLLYSLQSECRTHHELGLQGLAHGFLTARTHYAPCLWQIGGGPGSLAEDSMPDLRLASRDVATWERSRGTVTLAPATCWSEKLHQLFHFFFFLPPFPHDCYTKLIAWCWIGAESNWYLASGCKLKSADLEMLFSSDGKNSSLSVAMANSKSRSDRLIMYLSPH